MDFDNNDQLRFSPDQTSMVVEERSAEGVRSAETIRLQSILLDAVDEAIIATDLNGIIIYWNRYAEQLYGWSAGEVLGRPVVEITPDESSRGTAAAIMDELSRGMRWSGEMTLRRRDGSSFTGLVTDSPIHDERGTLIGVVGISNDIGGRKRMEMELQERSEALEAVNRIGELLAAELDLEKIVQSVTDAGTELTGAAFGSFFYNVLNEGGGTYMLYTLSGAPREAFRHFPMPRATELFGPTFRGEGVIRIHDVRKDPRYGSSSPYYGMPEGHLPVVSYLAVPVISRSGEVLGGLFFGHPEPGVFTRQMERILVGIAAQTAIAMDNARLFTEAQREIEERRRTEHELQKAMAVAQAASSAKDQFLAALSHELRTPLTPVLATISMLEEDDTIPADLLPFIQIIRRNIELEARLIDDLLDLTRITKGKLQLNLEPLDAHALLRNVIGICSEELQEKRIDLRVELNALGHHINADSARLQQVFWNLLKNAVKFTLAGESVIVRTSNDPDGALRVEVIDTGIGIEPDVLTKIFNAFEQGEPQINRQFGGLGLGLAISRNLVQMHGGTITAASDGKGAGAHFTVVLRG